MLVVVGCPKYSGFALVVLVLVRLVGLGLWILLISMLVIFFPDFFLGTAIRDKSSIAISSVTMSEMRGFGFLVCFVTGETKSEGLVLLVLGAGKAAGAILGVGLMFDALGLDMIGMGCRSN